jgi:hypothetical protein
MERAKKEISLVQFLAWRKRGLKSMSIDKNGIISGKEKARITGSIFCMLIYNVPSIKSFLLERWRSLSSLIEAADTERGEEFSASGGRFYHNYQIEEVK